MKRDDAHQSEKSSQVMKVGFDTNVAVSVSFWRGSPFDCLTAWAQVSAKRLSVRCCLRNIAKYHEALEELRLEYPKREPVEWVVALTKSAELVFPSDRAKGATPDPEDEMILECALAAEADFIVSGEKKHLLPLREFHSIQIVSPADFLRRLTV